MAIRGSTNALYVCGLLLFAGTSAAQQYVISTIAGGVPPPTPAMGINTSIGVSNGVATDGTNNIYFTSLNCVFRLDQNGVITRVAGNSKVGYSGDGGAAVSAQLSMPGGIALDSAGNLFIGDSGNNRIRKVSTNGIITTIAGGASSYSTIGDGGPAASASLSDPVGIALDASGNIFIADFGNQRIRLVSTSGIITTVAGNGVAGFSGDGGLATSAQLFYPWGVAVDKSGNLLIADSSNQRIRKVSTSGVISTVAGNGTQGFSGDGGLATNAQLSGPVGIAVDASGNLFIAEEFNYRIRRSLQTELFPR